MKNIKIKSLKGMHDYFLEDIWIINYIESIFKSIMINYSYNEIRFPILEKTQLFNKIVSNNNHFFRKEMYSFLDKNNVNITLRPEGTISCVRAYLENNLYLHKFFQKLWYIGPMFRYENTQKGRFRQFYQIGVEVLGYKCLEIDLELILIIKRLWNLLGIDNLLNLEINTIGSVKDRNIYLNYLVSFLKPYKKYFSYKIDNFYKINPLKLFDSKDKDVQKILINAPKIINYINKDSFYRFRKLCKILDLYSIKYTINTTLVRGLDYYNDFVFEWKCNFLGSQNTVCAGGRYDNLVAYLANFSLPAVGFAVGLERLLIILKQSKKNIKNWSNYIDIYVVSFLSSKARLLSISIVEDLLKYSDEKVKIYNDFFLGKNIDKKIMNIINLNPKLIILIGNKELRGNFFTLKTLFDKNQIQVCRKNLVKIVFNILNKVK